MTTPATFPGVLPLLRRAFTHPGVPIIHIPKANIYPFGVPSSASAVPSFRNVEWTVNEGEAWAVVSGGGASKTILFQTLLGNLRISPPPPSPGGLYPFLTGLDPFDGHIGFVAFRHSGGRGGGFYDYTARYGAVRDEEKRTLRESFEGLEEGKQNALVEKLGLTELLDLPLIALSNGQTRRARIARAVMKSPEVLLLDEPLTGLDTASRSHLLTLLEELHSARAPRIIMGMRAQEELPAWVTHVLEVGDGIVRPRRRGRNSGVREMRGEATTALRDPGSVAHRISGSAASRSEAKVGGLVVDLRGVGVKYGDRTVLNDITWQIHKGERWHLQGSNGSGKTTLLSLLTGDHPQSYTQAHLHLPSLSPSASSPTRPASSTHPHRTHHLHPRKRTPTAHLRSLVGVVSPELFDAFPRRHPGMSVWEAVVTGFGGGFVPIGGSERVGELRLGDEELGFALDAAPSEQEKEARRRQIEGWRVKRCWEVLRALGPAAWSGKHAVGVEREFAKRSFSSLSAGEQRIVLLMRALVGRPPLVLLDEVWSGMDEGMISAVRRYLREGSGIGEEQAVVVVTHWEEEVPWSVEEGVRRFRIERGGGGIVES